MIRRVTSLFHGHHSLIQKFNKFLPVGYYIEVGTDAQSSEIVTVTTPSGVLLHSTNSSSTSHPASTPVLGFSNTPRASAGSTNVSTLSDQERQGVGPATDYVQRIKTQFINDPDTYKQFLDILAGHRSSADNVCLCCDDFHPVLTLQMAG